MKIRFQCIGLVFVTALGTAVARDGSGGYLATVGPAALRFQTLCSPAPPLPPLESGDKPSNTLASELATFNAAEVTAQPTLPVTEKAEAKSGDIPEISTNSLDEQALISTDPVGTDFSRDSAITPQMFLRFFAQSTNSGQSSIIVLPVRFTPAPPGVPPSSSAQYDSTK